MQCDVSATSDVNKWEQQTEQKGGPFVFHTVTERWACHTCSCWNPSFGAQEERSLLPGGPCFFLCCGHMAKFLLLSVAAGLVCTAAHDRLGRLA